MSKLPTISGKQAVAAFKRAGFVVDRVTGSHHILKSPALANILTIPVHGGKTLSPFILKSQIKVAGLTEATSKASLDRLCIAKAAIHMPDNDRLLRASHLFN